MVAKGSPLQARVLQVIWSITQAAEGIREKGKYGMYGTKCSALLAVPATALAFAASAHSAPGDTYIAAVASVQAEKIDWAAGTDPATVNAEAMSLCRQKSHPDCTFVVGGTPCIGVALLNGHLYGATGATAEQAENAAIAKAGDSSAEYNGHCATDTDFST